MMASDLPPPGEGTAASPPSGPALPPPLPPPLPAAAASTASVLKGRLHPFTLFFTLWHGIRNVLVPLVLVFLLGRKSAQDDYLVFGMVMVGVSVAFSVVRYFTFTYRLEHGELVTAHGVLGRTERHIPLARVQDVRIEQGLVQRLFKVVEVRVETAGGHGAEASLSVLSRTEAERLRAAVFEGMPRSVAAGGAGSAAPAREVVRRLSVGDLVLAGLTSNRMASALVLVLVLWQKLDEILPQKTYEHLMLQVTQSMERWVAQGGDATWPAVLAGAVAVLVTGMAMSVIGSVVLFYGFTLSRSGEDLHRAYGLFTRRSSSLPRRRIQVLKIEETWLRRLCRLAALRVDTAGSAAGHGSEGRGGRDVVLPLARRSEVEGLLPVLFPDLEAEAQDWRQVSRRAVRRGTMKGTMVCAVVAAVLYAVQQTSWMLWPLALVPVVYGLNVMSYRRQGYCLGERFFRTRRGWLSRATHLVPVRNAQVVVLRQTPLDRWHGVGTVRVDTAGQAYTGGGPEIANVPWAEALAMARSLAQRAAATRYRW